MAATSKCSTCDQEIGDFAGHLCVEQYGWFYETTEPGMGKEGKVWAWALYPRGPIESHRRAYRAIRRPFLHDKATRVVTA
jgi:hypothetical protein